MATVTKPEADKPNPPTDEPAPRADRLTDDLQLQALRLLQADPALSQRDLAQALGISLGRTNYCMRALIDQGWIKIQGFRNSRNKLAYLDLLTPQGIDAKARITARFRKRKLGEGGALKAEIAQLQAKVGQPKSTPERQPRCKVAGQSAPPTRKQAQ
jgi:EPS-associated MarR family transcriptional regulator